MEQVEKWGMFEICSRGKQEGNPFRDYTVTAVFEGGEEKVRVNGFYDGEGIYRARFMPSFEGEYSYRMEGNFSDSVTEGRFMVVPPSTGNHGPVIASGPCLRYRDGNPCQIMGTTCYAWVHQTELMQEKTLRTLKENVFNKLRFCFFLNIMSLTQKNLLHIRLKREAEKGSTANWWKEKKNRTPCFPG